MTAPHPSPNLVAGFLRSAERWPDRPALEVGGRAWSYAELRARAIAVAGALRRTDPGGDPPLTGILGGRSAATYSAILGALLRGHGYVPLGPLSAPRRARALLERSGCRALVADAAGEAMLEQVVSGRAPAVEVVRPDALDDAGTGAVGPDPPGPIAAMFFTSGSTGEPKGVPVGHAPLLHHLDHVVRRYGIAETDRLSQVFDLGFDVSAFDLFAAWERGACVCAPGTDQLLRPVEYAREARLTVFYAVPSTALFEMRVGGLVPGALPGLRTSLFIGENLPVSVAAAWAAAAPNGVLDNLYGPTEATLSCAHYRWDGGRTPGESENGIVPIGDPDPGTRLLVLDPDGAEVDPGATGELLLAGPQVTGGYWRDPARTAEVFVRLPGREGVWYRTGDRVRRPLPGRPMTILGRLDDQLQIRGQRVEPGEVEAALREAAGTAEAAAIGWPPTERGADGIVAFLAGTTADPREVRARLAARLPGHAVPRRIRVLPELPRGPSGKIDRRALADLLSAESREPPAG